jgi:exopolyphosphatase/guanosine-5'-triphosphate,3'-diphosphate pyrophosphatase
MQEVLAAVDLGSNSFHMVIARDNGEQLSVVDRVREPVCLAAGITPYGGLTAEAQTRALGCLQRFAQRLAGIPRGRVRVVGTNTLRKAKRAKGFVAKASTVLGHAVHVLPGREEARLIYQGVVRTTPGPPGRPLVIDIGGGSCEAILGEGLRPRLVDSLHMGCVSYSLQFFAQGRVTKKRLKAARMAAGLEWQSVAQRYRNAKWDAVFGASGTIKAVATLLTQSGWGRAEEVTLAGMRQLAAVLIDAARMDRLQLPGLDADRRAVLPGGLAILMAAFEQLEIATMRVSQGALREGVLFDLAGRLHDGDPREQTIQSLMQRYEVDPQQAQRVHATAAALFDLLAAGRNLNLARCRRYLRWACLTHEMGLAVNYAGHHRHGAYLLENGDLPGFDRQGQRFLALLVQSHRRKLATQPTLPLSRRRAAEATVLILAIRLSVLLNRARAGSELPRVSATWDDGNVRLSLPRAWLLANPLTLADLQQEHRRLRPLGHGLVIEAQA